MRIAIGSDHAGFSQKQQLIGFINGLGHEVYDCGPATDERCDYPDFALKVGLRIARGQADRGVLVCGTGIGMALAADKVAGVRAATITSPKFAELSRQHNDLNVIALSGRFVDFATNGQIVKAFLEVPFEGGRHALRVAKIMELDPDALPQLLEEQE